MVEAARAPQSRGIKPRTLVNIVIVILLLALIGLIVAYCSFTGGGGIVSRGQKAVGSIEFLFAVYGPGTGERPRFQRPLAVATDKDGNIYVSDTGNFRVCKFNRTGGFQWLVGGTQTVAKPAAGVKATWKEGTFNFPYGIDTDDQGNVYVGDLDNNFIQVFDATGRYLRRFPDPFKSVGKGSSGLGGGGIAITQLDVQGQDIYVCDKFQIIKMGLDGTFKMQFGMPGRGANQMVRPNGVVCSPQDGAIFVSDSNNQRVQAYNAKGKMTWQLGKPGGGPRDLSPRMFGLPRGMDIGPDKNLYVADVFHFSIHVLTQDGKRLAEVGERGTTDGKFNFPNDLACRSDGVIYVADRENDRIQAIRIKKFTFPPAGS